MTLHINPEAVAVLLVGCIVGLAVYKHTAQTHCGAPTRGDLVGAIGATVGVITVLALLLSMGESGKTPQNHPAPGPAATTHTSLDLREAGPTP